MLVRIHRKSNPFFEDIHKDHPKSTDGKWMVQYLCWLRTKKYPKAVFTGFKWKPYGNFSSIDVAENYGDVATKEQMATLRRIANLAKVNAQNERDVDGDSMRQQGPHIRVLRSRRNPIDVVLSRHKHDVNTALGPHCKGDDPNLIKECLKQYDVGKQTIPNVNEFYKKALKLWNQENEVDTLLREMKIPTAFVTYDALFYPANEKEGEYEWNRALRFARGGPIRPEDVDADTGGGGVSVSTGDRDRDHWKTWKDIQGSMKFAATTSSRNHKDLISNWEEFREKIAGTPLEQFLRID